MAFYRFEKKKGLGLCQSIVNETFPPDVSNVLLLSANIQNITRALGWTLEIKHHSFIISTIVHNNTGKD